jgi:hypothetical protein
MVGQSGRWVNTRELSTIPNFIGILGAPKSLARSSEMDHLAAVSVQLSQSKHAGISFLERTLGVQVILRPKKTNWTSAKKLQKKCHKS